MSLTKSAILAAVKSAIKASQAKGGAAVAVDLPGWEGYELRSYKALSSRVSQHPSTFIKVRHVATRTTAWDTTAGHLDTICGAMARRAKEFGGWAGPVSVTYIPVDHPAHSYGPA